MTDQMNQTRSCSLTAHWSSIVILKDEHCHFWCAVVMLHAHILHECVKNLNCWQNISTLNTGVSRVMVM